MATSRWLPYSSWLRGFSSVNCRKSSIFVSVVTAGLMLCLLATPCLVSCVWNSAFTHIKQIAVVFTAYSMRFRRWARFQTDAVWTKQSFHSHLNFLPSWACSFNIRAEKHSLVSLLPLGTSRRYLKLDLSLLCFGERSHSLFAPWREQ